MGSEVSEQLEWGILDGSIKVMICWVDGIFAKISNGEQSIIVVKSRLTF